jgi:hypothetical protein
LELQPQLAPQLLQQIFFLLLAVAVELLTGAVAVAVAALESLLRIYYRQACR